MIGQIITDYLSGNNRRLVLPGFGAFLKKEDSSIVFVPFLNKDDGVLNSEVAKSLNVSQEEAAAIIAQYTEGMAETMAARGSYYMDGIGTLKKDVNGIIFLDTTPQAAEPEKEKPQAGQPKPAQPAVADKTPAKVNPSVAPAAIKKPSVASTAPQPAKQTSGVFSKPETHPAPAPKRRKGPDLVLIIAIIIAIAALAAMAYGFFATDMPIFNLG